MKKLYHGACYYPELWPESDIERDVVEMKRLGLNVVRLGEFAWSKMEPSEGAMDFRFFVRVLDRLHAAGIYVIFCTPTPTPPIWLTHGKPERCFVDQEGRVMSHGARQHASYEHPEVRRACLRIVRELAKTVGRHPAVIAWQIDNEFKCHVAEDFNAHAVKHWHQWLAARYGTVEQLNEAWGTEVWSERYERFDQVPAPVVTPFLHNASLSTAYRMFSRESIAEFCDAQAAVIREFSDAPITHNSALPFAVSQERLFRNLDFASFDDYPSSKSWETIVLDNDFYRTLKPGRAHWLMETSVTHNGWFGNHETAHPPGFLRAEAVASYALGAEGVNYWLWRQQRTGCEMPHSAIFSSWYAPTLGYNEVQEVERARAALEPLLLSSRIEKSDTMLTWSDLGRAMFQTEPLGVRPDNPIDYVKVIGAWHAAVMALGIHRDVAPEQSSLEGVRLLVTPMMASVSSDFARKVEAFVRAGGVWLCGPNTGVRTEEHGVPTDSGLGRAAALGGVDVVYSYPITGTGAVGAAFGIEAPLAGWCSVLKPNSPVTHTLGVLHTPHADGAAFLTERRLGSGYVITLGVQPSGEEGESMVKALLAHCADRAGVTRHGVSPGSLVCPRVRDDGKRLYLLVNMDGKGGSASFPHAVRDVLAGDDLPAEGKITVGPYAWRALVAI